MKQSTPEQYRQFNKPRWAPPSSVFGPVWTFLYTIILISFIDVAYVYFTHQVSFWIFLPFVLNVIFNAIYTPIQFGFRNQYLALLDILLVDATLIWAMVAIYPLIPWVAVVNTPYLVWVLFATVLQSAIAWMNR